MFNPAKMTSTRYDSMTYDKNIPLDRVKQIHQPAENGLRV